MKFKAKVSSLKSWLSRATTSITDAGKQEYKYYFFTVEDNVVFITRTNGNIFTKIQTKITPEDFPITPFDVGVSSLTQLLDYTDAEDIQFEVEGDIVRVWCGEYFGRWKSHNLPEGVEIDLPALPTQQPVSLEEYGLFFVNAVNKVRRAARDKVTFRNGFCYAGGDLNYQEVETGLPPDFDCDLIPAAYDVVKFLRANPGFTLAFNESESHLFFYDGGDTYVCPKFDSENYIDWKNDWDKKFAGEKKVKSFIIETGVLTRAVMRVSLTSDESSLSIALELGKNHPDINMKTMCYDQLSNIYHELGDQLKAEEFTKEVLELSKKHNFRAFED